MYSSANAELITFDVLCREPTAEEIAKAEAAERIRLEAMPLRERRTLLTP